MRYLVDADVLSELTKPAPDQRAVQWLYRNESELAVSPIVLGELEYGILVLPAGSKRRKLQRWFSNRIARLRVCDLDATTAAAWAILLARMKKRGLAMPIKDSLIAATALVHGLTVATRNTADFRNAGVPLVNPFEK